MESQMITEQEHLQPVTVIEVAPMGYGNPDSSISRKKQLESGELEAEVDTKAQEFIISGEGIVEVQERDDGCIDGRETSELYVTEGGEFYTKSADNSNHERAKVAGGGYITTQAMRIGVGARGDSIDEDLARVGADLAEKEIYCGAHSGAHQHGEGTDCGANDKFPLILENGLKFREQIQASTEVLVKAAGLEFHPEVLERVLANWQATLDDENYFEGSTGASRLKTVLATQAAATEAAGEQKPLAVTKHLDGDHNEDYIIVNYVEGTTFSQGAFAETLREAFPDKEDKNLAQAFVVDAWRIVELAKAAVGEEEFEAAIYAGVAYQVATAATLTDGTLKMFAYTQA